MFLWEFPDIFWVTLNWKSPGRKEFTKQLQDLIVAKISGEGYKKTLDNYGTLNTITTKWRKYSERSPVTLKELQQFLASAGCSLLVTAIS